MDLTLSGVLIVSWYLTYVHVLFCYFHNQAHLILQKPLCYALCVILTFQKQVAMRTQVRELQDVLRQRERQS